MVRSSQLPDVRRVLLVALGATLIAYDFVQPSPGSTLVVVGAVSVVLGAMLPALTLTGIELGVGPVKATLVARDDEFREAFEDRTERFQQFAWLVCGDADEARDLVGRALEEARLHQRQQSLDTCVRFALCSLVTLLETAPERRRLGAVLGARAPHPPAPPGPPADPIARATLEALGRIELRPRIAYLLHCHLGLAVDEVADVLRRTPESVAKDIESSKRRLKRATAQLQAV